MISKRKLLPFIVFLVIFGTWLSLPPKKRHFIDNWRLTNYITRLGASHNLYDDSISLKQKNGAHYFTLPRDQGPVAGHANYTEALCHVTQQMVVPDLQVALEDQEVRDLLFAYVTRLPESPLARDLISYTEDHVSGHQCMAVMFEQIMLVLELGYFASWGLVEESRDFENAPKDKFVLSRTWTSAGLAEITSTAVPEVQIEKEVEEEVEEVEDDSENYDESGEEGGDGDSRELKQKRDINYASHLLNKYPSLLYSVKFNDMDYDEYVRSRDQYTSDEPFTTDHVYKNGEVEKIKHIQVPKLGPGHAAFMLRKTFNFDPIKISLAFSGGQHWQDFLFEPVLRGGQRAGRARVQFPGYEADQKVDGTREKHSFPHNDARFFGDQCQPKPEDVTLIGKVMYGADISMKLYPFEDILWLTEQAATAWQKVKWYDLKPELLSRGLLDTMCHFAHTNQGEAFNVEFGAGFKCSEGRYVPNLNYYYCQQLH